MKVLVAFYSRSGNTKKFAEEVASRLKADSDEIVDLKKRSGIFGWFAAGKDAFLNKETGITFSKEPSDYDLVVVGTPVWAGRITPAIRSYLNSNSFKRLAFFCTYGGQEGKAFENIRDIYGDPEEMFGVKGKSNPADNIKVKEFCRKLLRTFKDKEF